MKTTANFGLKKPESSDYVDVSVLSENMDTLDAEIPARYAKITHASQHGSGGADPVTPAAIGAYPNGIKGAVNCNNLSDGAWTISASATNGPGAFACTLFHKDWNADFASQIAFGSDHNVYYRVKTGGSWLAWQEMYSTLRYPSPSKIGAVAKAGDTMTGQLNVPAFSLTNYNAALEIGKNIDFHTAGSTNDYDARLAYDSGTLLFRLLGGDYKTILHTGNLSDLGVAKIATGSYVGTGVCGEGNENSLTFPFVPKVVMICADETQLLYGTSYGNHAVFGVLWDQLSSDYKNIGNNRYTSMMVKSVDKTMYWYVVVNGSVDASNQQNTSGKIYRYVAFG